MSSKKNSIRDFCFLQLILFAFSFSSVFAKIASGYAFLSKGFILSYGVSIFIIFMYAIAWQLMLKKFELTIAFSSKAVTVIWGLIWGVIFFNEEISIKKIIGGIIIIVGIILVVNSD